ncbi:hypothetical protein LMG26857_03620 [Achromobacter anxifer]|uniref:DUF262 domain-containing protein n=1 Tax=Achromobacter anxifer TaxID=1287737 RepID=UPI00155B44EA|nr:DUF262 domain-containing protein [Achromobacter anxifer]CAB5514561.1 hypothetical protein LMG26857_03620 [Achromobacter anxifer]
MKIIQNIPFLTGMLRDVQAGLIVPAAFQRSYVWGKADVQAMAQSLIRGYPLGGAMLWQPVGQPTAGPAIRRLGPIFATAAGDNLTYLLDGQNRLATLAWLAWEGGAKPDGVTGQECETWFNGEDQRRCFLAVDLMTKDVFWQPVAQAVPGINLPFSALLSDRANSLILERWSTSWAGYTDAEKDAALAWFDEAANHVRNARMVVTVLQGATAIEAKDAFLHICRAGVSMTEHEFERAVALV